MWCLELTQQCKVALWLLCVYTLLLSMIAVQKIKVKRENKGQGQGSSSRCAVKGISDPNPHLLWSSWRYGSQR